MSGTISREERQWIRGKCYPNTSKWKKQSKNDKRGARNEPQDIIWHASDYVEEDSWLEDDFVIAALDFDFDSFFVCSSRSVGTCVNRWAIKSLLAMAFCLGFVANS